MKDRQHMNRFLNDPVRCEVRCPGNHNFPRSFNASNPASIWHATRLTDDFANSAYYSIGRRRAVGSYVIEYVSKLV
jgi:hypothetical protein